jgi:hypothetical protein
MLSPAHAKPGESEVKKSETFSGAAKLMRAADYVRAARMHTDILREGPDRSAWTNRGLAESRKISLTLWRTVSSAKHSNRVFEKPH